MLRAYVLIQTDAGGGSKVRSEVGMTFAAAWTPCIGPILGAILASRRETSDPTRIPVGSDIEDDAA